MFRTVQIIFGVIGLLAVFAGDRFSMPVLLYGGIVCFGFMAMAIGWEAIITQHMVTGSRRRGSRQTYSGLPAMLQGIQFNLIGIFLIVISAIAYLKYQSVGREIFLQFVRHPGIPPAVLWNDYVDAGSYHTDWLPRTETRSSLARDHEFADFTPVAGRNSGCAWLGRAVAGRFRDHRARNIRREGWRIFRSIVWVEVTQRL